MAQPFFTYDQLRDWPAHQTPPILAVLGDPVAHSLSPQLHTPALRACGIDGEYIRLEIKADEFPAALVRMQELNFAGANVTIPHKFIALRSVDRITEEACRLGAVNTILFKNGLSEGRNSDGPGFVRAIAEDFGVTVRDLRVLIIGAGGGAGRAVAVQCALEGCQRLSLVNRSVEKLAALQSELREFYPANQVALVALQKEVLQRALREADLVINATNLGMKPDDAPVLAGAELGGLQLAYDMVYRPYETDFVRQARAVGVKASNGLSMLLHQGAVSFEWWFDQPAPVAAMRAGLLAAV